MPNYHVMATIMRRWDLLKCERSDLTTPSHCLPLFAFSETPSPSRCKQYETITLLTPKIRFLMLMLCPMSFTPSSLEGGGGRVVYLCLCLCLCLSLSVSLCLSLSLSLSHTLEQRWIFAWNMNHANKTSSETFWHTQVWDLKYLSLTVILFLFLIQNSMEL